MSLIIRPDPFFGIFRQRAARQVFLFEKASLEGGGMSFVGSLDVRCPSEDERERFFRSRRWKEALWCAAGYLRPPSHMTPGRGYHIPLLDFYSTHSGLLPFPCTPYVSHHDFFGYVCGQAAVYLCLEMALRFGATPHSPATINHILSTLHGTVDYDPKDLVATCPSHRCDRVRRTRPAERSHLKGFYNMPMHEKQLKEVFESELLGTRGLRVNLNMWPDPALATVLHLKAMLDSGIPVIAILDFDALAEELGSNVRCGERWGHVVTVIGYVDHGGGAEFKIVFHDGQLGPYRELPLSLFMNAALATADHHGHDPCIATYSPLPLGVSPEGYLGLLQEVYPVLGPEMNCNIRLMRVSALRRNLLAYAPGEAAAIRFDQMEKLIQENADAYIWSVEYHDETGTYLDLVGTQPAADRRLGVLVCGRDTQRERWRFIVPEGKARWIDLNPAKTKRMIDEGRSVWVKKGFGR